MTYQETASKLELPNAEQTAAFADYVIEQKRWDELLPVFPPGNVFAFFLDPDAGKLPSAATTENSSAAAHYRQKFGCWNYWWGDEEALRHNPPWINVDLLRTEASGAVSFFGRTRRRLPTEIMWQCSCRLSAFISGQARHRCAIEELRDFLVEYEHYAERFSDPVQRERCGKLRQGLKEAKVFSLNPNSYCEIEIKASHAEIVFHERRAGVLFEPIFDRCIAYVADFGDLAVAQQTLQRDELVRTLLRSREVFAALRAPSPTSCI